MYVIEAGAVGVVARMVVLSLVLGLYISVMGSRLIEGRWWKYFVTYLVTIIVRDALRLTWTYGVLPLQVYAPLEWAANALMRVMFVCGFVTFAGKDCWRTWPAWAAIFLGVIDLFSSTSLPVPMPEGLDSYGRLASGLTGPLYLYVIWLSTREVPSCRTRAPCLLSGFLFSTRYWFWMGAEQLGVVTGATAKTGSLIWGGLTVTLMLMCFLTTNLLLVARQRAEYEEQVVQALGMAAAFVEMQNEPTGRATIRPNRQNGIGPGATERVAQGGVGAGQAG